MKLPRLIVVLLFFARTMNDPAVFFLLKGKRLDSESLIIKSFVEVVYYYYAFRLIFAF